MMDGYVERDMIEIYVKRERGRERGGREREIEIKIEIKIDRETLDGYAERHLMDMEGYGETNDGRLCTEWRKCRYNTRWWSL